MEMQFGDYELLEEIGRGGQGVVYRARQKSLNRTVALKVIGLGQWSSTPHLKRFRHEAEAAASLEHPQIVPIYEIGERDGSCYFSMKFVEGGRLDEVAKRQPMSARRTAELLVKIARTVQFAHEHGILHRDIKPGNILLDKNGEPHLTDFGLARLIEQESTITNSFDVLGTPSYMPPEQAAGHARELTPAADVYSLGAVFYHMLTGEPPFAGGTTYETIRMVLETEPRNPRARNAKVDVDLATICLKCLEKDQQRRYASALALAEDLERWLKHEPIRARRTGIFTRGRKWVRRNPARAVLVLSLIALAAAIGVLVWNRAPEPPPAAGIAVLPFENVNGDKDDAVFADGIQDDVLTKLAKVADLKVINRTSVMQYRGARNTRKIGQALRVSHVLEGSVQRVGNRVRVSVQLINATNDDHIWAENYEREVMDLFALQRDLALQIASVLRTKLSPDETARLQRRPTQNGEAYLVYLQAQETAYGSEDTAEDLKKAKQLYQKAIQLDPSFALAFAQLSYMESAVYHSYDSSPAQRVKAQLAANEALRLQPDLPEAHASLGYYYLWCENNYDRALAELTIAAAGLPNDADIRSAIGSCKRRQGKWKESIPDFEKAVSLNPKDWFVCSSAALTYEALHQYEAAAMMLDRAVAANPDFFVANAGRARLDIVWKGDLTRMEQLLARTPENLDPDGLATFCRFNLKVFQRKYDEALQVLTRSPLQSFSGFKSGETPHLKPFLVAQAYQLMNDKAKARASFEEARAIAERLVRENPLDAPQHSLLGQIYAGLDRKDDAVAEGKRAVELVPESKDAVDSPPIALALAEIYVSIGDFDSAIPLLEHSLSTPGGLTIPLLTLDPVWDPLRDDPRFAQILAEAAEPIPLK